MHIRLLRLMDRLFGPLLLALLVPLAWAASLVLPALRPDLADARHLTFLKLKGGGSLIIAFPALLALRRAAPDAKFTLVCTQEAKIYAELTGIFDSYAVVEDGSTLDLAFSALAALRRSFRTDIFIDLEVNSILASTFTILTLARRRIGFVKPEESYRARAYTDALSFNLYAPIYNYYDQVAELLGAKLPSGEECRSAFRQNLRLPTETLSSGTNTIGIAAFTSDFAPERMMPPEAWAEFLKREPHITQLHLYGSAKNKPAADEFISVLRLALPNLTIVNKCGEGTLRDAAASFVQLGEFWSVDSGLLHIARLAGLKCKSFWGPTRPEQRLRPMREDEVTVYNHFICSPCVHLQGRLPCRGDNRCMKTLADDNPDRTPIWLA